MTRRQKTPETHPSLESLMEAYQRSDEQAVAELVRRLTPMLRNFFLGKHVTRRHSDDLLQDCWMRVHRARHTYQPGRPVLPWIYAIARYARADEYRRMARVDANPDYDVEPLPDPRCLEQTSAATMDLRTLLAKLPVRQREVVQLLKLRGLSLEEAARATGSTINATKQRAHRAYMNLRAMARSLQPRSGQGAGAH